MIIIDIPQTLRSTINQYGFPSPDMAPRFIGLIKDIFVDQPREVNLLIIGIEERIPEKLRDMKGTVSLEILSGPMIEHLMQSRGLDCETAEWIVQIWADTLEFTPIPIYPSISRNSQNIQSSDRVNGYKGQIIKGSINNDTSSFDAKTSSLIKKLKCRNYLVIGISIIIIIFAAFVTTNNTILTNPQGKVVSFSPISLNSSNSPEDSGYWFVYGQTMMNEDNYSEAIKAFENDLKENPNDINALAWKGYALVKLDRFHEANSVEDLALTKNPNLSEAWYFKALALDMQGNYMDALNASERALSIDSNSEKSWIINGDILSHSNQYRKAIVSYNMACNLVSSDKNYGLRKIAISNILTTTKNRAYLGNDYKTLSVNGCEECQLACALDTSCEAFTYTELSEANNKCYLKDDASEPIHNEYSVSGTLKD